jgi:replication-associated recombination protein RarA
MNTLRTLNRAIFGELRRLCRLPTRRDPTPESQATLPLHPEHQTIIRRVLSSIHNNSILLRGAPGSGKKAILRRLEQLLIAGDQESSGFLPISIDLHGVHEILLFATVGEAVTRQAVAEPIMNPEDRNPDPSNAYGHRDLANDIRKVLRMLRDRGTNQPRLVLLVDGIDELNTYSPRTAQRVRSLFMASLDGNLVMVATAVEIDRRWEEEGSPWYNFFEEIEVSAPRNAEEPALE